MSDTDFAGLTEGLCIRFWGKPTEKTAKTLRWGTGGSRSYSFEKQAWYDHEAGKGGGAIALVERECSTDRDGALAWMEKEGLIEGRHVASAAQQRQGAPPADDPPFEPDAPPADTAKPVEKVIKGYRYTDGDGNTLYEVIRYHFQNPDGSWVMGKTGNPKKTFKQRRPDGRGGYIWGLGDVPHTIWRRQQVEIAIAEGKTIYLAEGEKDVETLEQWGLVGTTNSGGAQNWRPEFAEFLRGADVVILADTDEAGQKRVDDVAMSLREIAKRVRAVTFWDDQKDVTDWRDRAGGTADQLSAIVGQLPDWRPRPPVSKFGAMRATQLAGAPIIYKWLIKGLVEDNGILMLAGEKQSAKTFVALDMGMKIARGLEYGDRKTKHGLVIHMACEDGKGVKMRVEGYRRRNNISPDKDIPYIVMDPEEPGAMRFTLMSDESVDAFIEEVLRWAAYYDLPVAMIWIDTLSKATEGLDEINGAEVGKVLARADRIRLKTGATVGLIHHMNAGGQRVRGHSSLEANVPNVLTIAPLMTIPQNRREMPQPVLDGEGRHIRQIVLTKNKNGLNNLKWKVVLEVVNLGLDEDGDPITTCVCTRPAKSSRGDNEADHGKLSQDQKLVYDALVAAQTDEGAAMPPGSSAPPQIKHCAPAGTFVGRVRKAMNFTATEEEVEARNKELQAFLKRTTTALINAGYMGRDNDKRIVWWTGKSDRPRPPRREPDPPPPPDPIPADVREAFDRDKVPF